tara:strand:- start:464 stop:817 length:354 start_codon:yes stop_codon:yes gene_type:complete
MHEPALILFQTGFHISTQITILHPMSKSKVRGSYMKTKIRKDQLTKEEMEEFKNKNCKLLSSKQLAELLQVTEGAIRKQRSKDRSLFPYAKLGGRIFYPADLIVETLHKNLTQSQAR